MNDYNFEKHLIGDEKIIYTSRPTLNKKSKSLGGCVFVLIFLLGIQALMILSLVFKIGDGQNGINFDFILIFLVTILFEGLLFYKVIYDLFLKNKKISDDCYCLTNERAFKYEARKKELVSGYLINYENIYYESLKDGYGDVYMCMQFNHSNDSKKDLLELKNLVMNKDKENMHFMVFESVKNPRKIVKLAKELRDKQLEKYNSNIK